jgi:type II secretory pathway pseudopilin PulG
MLGLKRFRDGEQGIGLVEVLVALAIFAAVGVVFLMGLQTSGKAVIISQKNVTAEGLAKSKMEEVKGVGYLAGVSAYTENITAVPSDLVAQGYSFTVIVSPLPDPPYDDTNIQKVTVIIYHSGEEAFRLEDYKVNR